MRPMLWMLAAGAITVADCKGKTPPVEGGPPAARQGMGTTNRDSMPMGGDQMSMGESSMMATMRAHMDSMARMSPDQMSDMMAAHDRMMSQVMDRMGADMRGMHMSGDAKWNALVDSVKADLADLPGLQGKDLAEGTKAHADRVRRLISMHQDMMKGM